jgi:hypothetical protein
MLLVRTSLCPSPIGIFGLAAEQTLPNRWMVQAANALNVSDFIGTVPVYE